MLVSRQRSNDKPNSRIVASFPSVRAQKESCLQVLENLQAATMQARSYQVLTQLDTTLEPGRPFQGERPVFPQTGGKYLRVRRPKFAARSEICGALCRLRSAFEERPAARDGALVWVQFGYLLTRKNRFAWSGVVVNEPPLAMVVQVAP